MKNCFYELTEQQNLISSRGFLYQNLKSSVVSEISVVLTASLLFLDSVVVLFRRFGSVTWTSASQVLHHHTACWPPSVTHVGWFLPPWLNSHQAAFSLNYACLSCRAGAFLPLWQSIFSCCLSWFTFALMQRTDMRDLVFSFINQLIGNSAADVIICFLDKKTKHLVCIVTDNNPSLLGVSEEQLCCIIWKANPEVCFWLWPRPKSQWSADTSAASEQCFWHIVWSWSIKNRSAVFDKQTSAGWDLKETRWCSQKKQEWMSLSFIP